MKRSEAARYARWSAIVAGLLAAATLAVYLKREVVKFRDIRNAPAAAPVNVERQSNGLTFSKVDGNRTIFTVNAGKSTEFKDKGASLLEDVRITIFGKTGERHDTIHTQSCQYGKDAGNVVCSGQVQIDMQSAADAARVATDTAHSRPQIVHVETSGVTFNRSSGAANTPQPVKFTFPGGSGDAVGVEYNSDEGTAQLLHDVKFTLQAPAPANTTRQKETPLPTEDVYVRGTTLDFARDAHLLHLLGPAQAETKTARLTAGEITLELNETFQAQHLVATSGATGKQPEMNTQRDDGATTLAADRLSAQFAAEGWVEKLNAEGHVHGAKRGTLVQDEFSAELAALDVWPRLSEPKELNLNGNVVVKTRASKSSDSRLLQTSALRMEFSGGNSEKANHLKKAETLGPGSMEWSESASSSAGAAHSSTALPATTKLAADKMELGFGPKGKATSLAAAGNVKTERHIPGQPAQTASANKGTAQIADTGGWSRMELQGNVTLNQGDHHAEAGRALFMRAAQSAALTEQAVVRDATTETRAAKITFSQSSGDIAAEGAVRSTDFSPKGSTPQLASGASNLTADAMQANSKTGRALYTGHARLWQGDSVMEADSIELLRDKKNLNAFGNVRAIFPQSPAAPGPGQTIAPPPAKKPNLWHISAASLTYSDADNLAHLEKNVVVQSADQRIRAAAMDLYFTRAAAANPSTPNTPSAQQITKAIGTGGVIVEEGIRKASADRGVYTAPDGKFVMSGGSPTLADGSRGATTGRQLTFFLADDTIIVDSENGSRILTKHRVDR